MKSKEEVESILLKQDVYLPNGEVNATKVNIIAGTFTPQLVDVIWAASYEINVIDELEQYLWSLHENAQYEILSGVLRALYIVNGLQIPDIVEAILMCDDKRLYEIYFYEFLMDFDELKSDYQEEITDA